MARLSDPAAVLLGVLTLRLGNLVTVLMVVGGKSDQKADQNIKTNGRAILRDCSRDASALCAFRKIYLIRAKLPAKPMPRMLSKAAQRYIFNSSLGNQYAG
jgi:hypothetical protein